MSFPLDTYRPVSNLIFATYSTSQIRTIQYYDYNGTALFPQYNYPSGFDYTTKYSSESVGPYSVTASSNAANARLAFNGDSTTFYQNLTGSVPSTTLLANGFALYYGNNIIFNCTDFRDVTQATRGTYISGGATTYRWTSNTLLSSLISSQSGITQSSDGYSFTLNDAQPFSVTFKNSTSIVDPYKTNGIIGEWLQIQLPAASTNVQYFTIQSTNITACKVLGSSNLITWTDLTSGTSVSLNTPVRVTSAITSFYYIRLVVSAPLTSTFQVTDFALYNENGRINSYL
jgi:hypothetical protein